MFNPPFLKFLSLLCINFSLKSSTIYGKNPQTKVKNFSILNSRSYDSYLFIKSLICPSENSVYSLVKALVPIVDKHCKHRDKVWTKILAVKSLTMLLFCTFYLKINVLIAVKVCGSFHLKSRSKYMLCSGKFHVLMQSSIHDSYTSIVIPGRYCTRRL